MTPTNGSDLRPMSRLDTHRGKELILTVGLPYSGKSDWARRYGEPVVSLDAIRGALHGCRYIPTAENLVWATARLMVRALFYGGADRVILDATNLTAKRRAEWDGPDWSTHYKLFRDSFDKAACIERAAKDDPAFVAIIEKMAETAEQLTPDESCNIWHA